MPSERDWRTTSSLVCLEVAGATLAVVGVWVSYDVWRALMAIGVAVITIAELLDRRLWS